MHPDIANLAGVLWRAPVLRRSEVRLTTGLKHSYALRLQFNYPSCTG
jgi:hypothetical protein